MTKISLRKVTNLELDGDIPNDENVEMMAVLWVSPVELKQPATNDLEPVQTVMPSTQVVHILSHKETEIVKHLIKSRTSESTIE